MSRELSAESLHDHARAFLAYADKLPGPRLLWTAFKTWSRTKEFGPRERLAIWREISDLTRDELQRGEAERREA